MGSTGTNSSGGGGALTRYERWYFANATWTCPGPNTPIEILQIAPGGGGAGGSVPTWVGAAGVDGGNSTVINTPSGTTLVTSLGGGKGVAGIESAAKPAQNTQGFSLGDLSVRTGGAVMTVQVIKGCLGARGFMDIGSGGDAGDNISSPGGANDQVYGLGGNAGEVKTYYGVTSEDLNVTIGAAGTGGAAGSSGAGQAAAGQKGQPGATRIVWYE